MSVTLADSYRGHALNYPSSAKPDDHGLIAYDASESELRDKLSSAVYGTDNIPSLFSGHRPTTDSVLPHPMPHIKDDQDHVSHSIYSLPTSQQLLHPPPYGYDIPGLHGSPRGQFRPRSTKNEGHLPPHFPALSSPLAENDSSVSNSGILVDPSLHQLSGSIYDPAMTHNALPKLPLPEKHHHTLPQSREPDNAGYALARQTRPPNLVGQVGMPAPAPRPKSSKTRFTSGEDALLVHLKEGKNLTWLQIQDFFPGRTHNTLQVRYCQRLKTKDVNWTEEKVQRLKRAIAQYEKDRWRIISSKVGKGFGPEACRERANLFGRSPSRGL